MADITEKYGLTDALIADLPRQNDGTGEWLVGYAEDGLTPAEAPVDGNLSLDRATEEWIKRFDAATLAVSKRILCDNAEVTLIELPIVVVKSAALGSVALARATGHKVGQVFSRGK